MQEKLEIRGESIQKIYEYYFAREFLANRKYQRKLVWTVEEKQSFIDSIRQGFPVPLVLVAEIKYQGRYCYEIIDGMQRLNAIVSFVEGEFSLNGAYFDLEAIARTKDLLDSGVLRQKSPIMKRAVCTEIASYVFPLSIYKTTRQNTIEEIFQRINSNGKHLSQQELRQAGTNGLFPNLVRRVSCQIRGDVSHSEKLPFNEMNKISISNTDLDYGIYLDEIFWVSKGVISPSNIRDSRDEELVAHLLAYMILNDTSYIPYPTASTLNQFYAIDRKSDGEEESEFSHHTEFKAHKLIEEELRKKSPEVIEEQFLSVFNEIQTLLSNVLASPEKFKGYKSRSRRKKRAKNSRDYSFSDLIFGGKKTNKASAHFQVIFLALYELLIKAKMEVINYSSLAHKLDGIADTGMTIKNLSGSKINFNAEIRSNNIQSVMGIVKGCLRPKVGKDPVRDCWTTELQNVLTQSCTESNSYEFRIGLCNLDQQGSFNEKSFTSMIQTLLGIANCEPGSVGYVIVGVSDNDRDIERYKKIYSKESIKKFKRFHITGIQDEGKKICKNSDAYYSFITQKVDSASIPEEAKSQILRDIRYVSFYEKKVLVIKISSGRKPYLFNKREYFERRGNRTVSLSMEDYANSVERFLTAQSAS